LEDGVKVKEEDKENQPESPAPTKVRKRRWDVATTDETQDTKPTEKKSRWDQVSEPEVKTEEKKPTRRSRWDMAPALPSVDGSAPAASTVPAAPVLPWGSKGYLTDEELDEILPTDGYKV